MRSFIIPLLTFLFLSCATTQVKYDYDPSADFSSYRTYNYFSDINTGLSELDTKRLFRALDSVLQQKGMKLSEEPEFLINIQGQSYYNPQTSSVGVGVGGTGGNVGGGVSIGVPVGGGSMEREIIFDFVDNEKDQLFWQAVSSSNISEKASPDVRERKIAEIVSKVLSKYPPEQRTRGN